MSRQAYRRAEGGLVDRGRPVHFRFDGKRYQGYAGDTLASALLANGVHRVARSFKYHRPRGILGAGSEDPCALVNIGRDDGRMVTNARAAEAEIFEGLEAFSQNRWPSLAFDIGAVNDLLARFFHAGFYYKTFMGPPGRWMRFEPLIRKAAGLGEAPRQRDVDRYEHVNRHCDVLVIGGGAAGLAAARAASAAGARVILAEETGALGGRLLAIAPGAVEIDGRDGRSWVADSGAELEAAEETTVLTRTCAFGYYSDNWIGLVETLQDHLAPGDRDPNLPRERLWRVRAKRVVLATGAIERPLVFHNNDRPGVMLAGAAETFAQRYGVLPGRRVVLFANNDAAWASAFALSDAGADIAAIVDVRAEPPRRAEAKARGIAVHAPACIVDTKGRARMSGVRIAPLTAPDMLGGDRVDLACDLLAVSGGWSPNVALFSQSRGKLRWDEAIAGFRPAQSWADEVSVGACNGDFGLAAALAAGTQAGDEAARATGFDGGPATAPLTSAPDPAITIQPAFTLPAAAPRPRAFVDLHNDVTAKDLKLAVQEGYVSVEHAKRFTTLGMGADQGKTVGVNGFGVIAAARGETIPAVGVTTYRPPFKPVSFGAIAGQHVGAHFQPRRVTPMHAAHLERGAIFEPVGDWLRARAYPAAGEDFHAAVARECRAARSAAAMLDASTLGKIDIRGPDARTFLHRIYTNAWMKLKPGRCRYGLMLNEDGMVFDDGVTACLADDHFHMTTTSGGAANVLAWLEEYLQTEWPDLKVYMTSVTEKWAVASLCGPDAAAIAGALFDDLDPADLAFMDWRATHIAGVPVRVFRVSFSGEPTFEINIPARYGLWLWRQLLDRGVTPYGTEAMHVLRAEKGFIIVGQDTDGTVTPFDLGMAWAVKAEDFVGRRSLFRSDTARPDRPHFVGLRTLDPNHVLPEGAQVIAGDAETTPRTPMIGYVTSSYMSPTLNRSIALALVAGGRERMGETLHVARPGATPVPARICAVDFLTEGPDP